MKLKTKLTALCAGILLLVTVGLSGAMLWQVWEQSYDALQQRSLETLEALAASFEKATVRANPEYETPQSRKAFLTYCFRSAGVPGSALIADGEPLTVPTEISPEDYLDVSYGAAPQTARAFAYGRHFLILGKALDIQGSLCKVYLAADASYIHSDLLQLGGRFALLAILVVLLGLAAVWWLVGRTLRPLSELSAAADHIAAGNYSQRLPADSRDEVGLLAGSFNEMAQAVENHVDTLRERNERQKLFLGGVTHELKTPLTSLLLNVNTLQNVYLPEKKQETILASMDGQLHWLETMVRKLLTLLSMGKNVKRAPVSVPELLSRVRELARPMMEKYETSLEITCSGDVLPLDRDLMCIALVNLVENGAKASTPGQTIRILANETGFTVIDQGRGIPETDIKRVTDPFYMGDPSRSKANGGFGLGLALVKEIAAVHGAELKLTSTPGMGTTARIVFSADGNETVIGQ